MVIKVVGGIFYKETLPLWIRQHLSFYKCIVSELIFGRKKLFFTVLYRNPVNEVLSPKFTIFLENLDNLYAKIKKRKPICCFSQVTSIWRCFLLENLFVDINFKQRISEPTLFFRDDCKPSCIDVILTDQPNLVLNSGVCPSLAYSVKHQITYCKIKFPRCPNMAF